ncbi:MAG: hemerythrin family protein [Firmicutes bacterium]|nr:hemerythrin family protein [Bacillota bacterium]
MEFVEWTDKYSTGNPLVDAYHHIFFQMVQEFGASLKSDEGAPMADRVAFLVDYTFMHFDSEERMMEKAGYPDLEAHKQVHQHFRDQVKAIHQSYLENPDRMKAEEVLALVQEWFAHHILGEDMRYKPWLETGKA